jgi:hypothetical protein
VSEQDESSDYASAGVDDDVVFDVDAWLTDAKPPQRAVVVYGRGDLLSRLESLVAEPEEQTRRLGGSKRSKEITALREQIEESRRVLHVRGLLHAERNSLLKKYGGGDGQPEDAFDGEGYQVEAVSLAAVEPGLTVEQVKRLHAAIGEGQWVALWRAIDAATAEPVDIPLSRLGSEGTPDS